MPLPAPRGALHVENVSLVPPGAARALLKGIAFRLAPGESLGIIGPTAVGKSSLARLIVGAWRPTTGRVRLDGADVLAWNRAELGRHIGYLPQDVELFPGTVRENIARMAEGEPEAVVAAARLAGVHELILQLPQAYDTPIEDGGIVLSGGQRQRIALARALYGDPRLLVLDEPNANLDSEGEDALLQALAAAKARGITVVVIAHRPSILQHVDKMLVLKDGAVALFGDKTEVMAKTVPAARVVGAAPAGQRARVEVMGHGTRS